MDNTFQYTSYHVTYQNRSKKTNPIDKWQEGRTVEPAILPNRKPFLIC
jgi:hypothetical protein